MAPVQCAERVLIESDWNLKENASACRMVLAAVLIESDWNLKGVQP